MIFSLNWKYWSVLRKTFQKWWTPRNPIKIVDELFLIQIRAVDPVRDVMSVEANLAFELRDFSGIILKPRWFEWEFLKKPTFLTMSMYFCHSSTIHSGTSQFVSTRGPRSEWVGYSKRVSKRLSQYRWWRIYVSSFLTSLWKTFIWFIWRPFHT